MPEPENFYLCPGQNPSGMVKHVSIQNFKSIKSLEFEARRVNIFIGGPNAGKSNILEAISTLGVDSIKFDNYRNIYRFRNTINLFYKNSTEEAIRIDADNHIALIIRKEENFELYKGLTSSFRGNPEGVPPFRLELDNEGKWTSTTGFHFDSAKVRYYKFEPLVNSFTSQVNKYLLPPYGENLPQLFGIFHNFQETVNDFVENFGYKLLVDSASNTISLAESITRGIVLSYPYQSISDTLQRIIFYLAAIESNKNAILLFEEPEANTFPYYTKQLAERIAADESNQYFLVTHNPYFLNSLVQQTRIEDLNVFVTYMENYQTKVRKLSEDDFSKILDLDKEVFYNLDILGQNA